MALYTVPPDMKEKEKIVGGILTIYQFGWLLLGLVIAGAIFIMLHGLLSMYSLIIAVPLGLIVSLPFTFYKKNELTLFQYLRYSFLYRQKTKKMPNKPKGVIFK